MEDSGVLALEPVAVAAAGGSGGGGGGGGRRPKSGGGGGGGDEKQQAGRKRPREAQGKGGGPSGSGGGATRGGGDDNDNEPVYGKAPAFPVEKYRRPGANRTRDVPDKKLAGALSRQEAAYKDAAATAARGELLLTEEAG
jgi:hypothetical protein